MRILYIKNTLKSYLFLSTKNTKGVVLSIPMPGHHVGESVRSRIRTDVEKLEALIKEHDCIFLLMDTRESRWLPTLVAAANKKVLKKLSFEIDFLNTMINQMN